MVVEGKKYVYIEVFGKYLGVRVILERLVLVLVGKLKFINCFEVRYCIVSG